MHQNLRLMKWFNFWSDFRPYSPIAIVYYAQVTGSFASALLVYAIFSVSTSVFEIPTGIFSDKMGRRKTLLFGVVACIVSIVFYAIGGSFFMLALGAIFAGLQDSLYSGNNDALVYDSLAETNAQDTYHQHIGKINGMFQIGLGTSALLASVFAGISLSFIFWLSIIPQVIALLIAVRLIEPKVHFARHAGNIYAHLKEALTTFKNNYKLRNLSLSSILRFGMGEVSHQFQPAFISTVWPIWALGIYRSLCNVIAFIGFHQADRLLKKFSWFKVLLVGQLSSIAATLVAVIYPGGWSPLLIALTAIPFGIGMVALNALMQKEFSDQQRATMGSINSLFGNIFFAVFAYLFGLVADQLGTRSPIIITELLSLSVVYIYWQLFRKSPQSQ